MKKYIISTCLFLSFCLFVNAQTDDQEVWRKVDSLKKELKAAKGETKVNCLNRLAEKYFGIWDEDDRFRDTACTFSNQAYEEATKIKYKEGIAYALNNRAMCAMSLTDNDRNNNDKEPAYANAYKEARNAINYAQDLNNNYIIGTVYDNLRWMEKWRGTPDKFKTNTEQAILHFEKTNSNDFKGRYKASNLIICSGCKGTENLLGFLYLELSRTQTEFNGFMKEQIEKAISYYKKTGARSGLGSAYMSYGTLLAITEDMEMGIDYLKKAIPEFREGNNPRSELQALTTLCSFYLRVGDFENGLEYVKKSVHVAETLLKRNDAGDADSLRLGQAYYWMGRFYSIAGDHETAFSYMRKARHFYPNDPRWLNEWTIAMGDLFIETGKYDSALVYLEPFAKNQGGKPVLGNLYISLKQYDKALLLLGEASKLAEDRNNQSGLGHIYIYTAKAYFGKNDYASALNNARKGIALMGKVKRNINLIDGYQVLSEIYNKIGKNDSAYFYLKQYSILKDSLLNRQLFIRLNDYKKEAEELKRIGKIRLLEKDNFIKEQMLQEELLLKEQSEAELALLDKSNEIKDQQLMIKDQNLKEQTLLKEQKQSQLILSDKENKLKDQRLKQQSLIRNALIAGLFLILALGVFIFRSLLLKRKNERLQNEKKQAELQQKASELEMQALRAQMNPHFIFNCLSSINKFILKNDTDTASDYLTRFSRLIRQTLTNSQLSLIPLSDEIEMLRLYLDMERLRFSESFKYNITYENSIEPETIYVPPMLLQPFCENAIWHGLMHKDGEGKLEVVLSLEDGHLRCIIADNGIGRAKAAELKSGSNGKQKSLGLKITKERLAIFNNEKSVHDFYKTEDVLDANGNVAGTKVILSIRIKNPTHEPAKVPV